MVNLTSPSAVTRSTRAFGHWLRCLALILVLPASAQAAPIAVVSYNVMFGGTGYNLTGSPRATLPWDISAIVVSFATPIAHGNLNSLSSTPGIALASFFGLGSNTLEWSLSSPIADGTYATALAGAGPNALTDAFGNAVGGGAGYNQNFRVLFGDVNGDGVVDGADLASVIAAESLPYNVFADLNGDGIVNGADAALVPRATAVPEPVSLALLGIGLLGVGMSRKNRTGA